MGVYLLGIDPAYLVANMLKYTMWIDVMVGLMKAFIFGGIIAIVGCYKGMQCGEGAEGVGRATTEAVVFASISILISNFFLTLLSTGCFIFMVEVSHLRKSFGRHVILDDVSFRVETGESVVIIGRSGGGRACC